MVGNFLMFPQKISSLEIMIVFTKKGRTITAHPFEILRLLSVLIYIMITQR